MVPFLFFPAATADFLKQLFYHYITLPICKMQLSLEDSCGVHNIRFSRCHWDQENYTAQDHCAHQDDARNHKIQVGLPVLGARWGRHMTATMGLCFQIEIKLPKKLKNPKPNHHMI